MKFLLFLALAPALALAEADSPGYGPKFYCREANNTIYAEVCVPGFGSETAPVELAVKNVVDGQFCYEATRTECHEETRTEDREICTYSYVSKKEAMPATVTQVTYEEKSETMKVTTCSPSGYKSHYDSGEHQYCREEYQTQTYSVPRVDVPLEISVDTAVPEPVKECVTKTIEINEVVCEDVSEQRCIDVAEFEDATVSVDQTEVVLGEPNCNQISLSLPIELCSKHGYPHH